MRQKKKEEILLLLFFKYEYNCSILEHWRRDENSVMNNFGTRLLTNNVFVQVMLVSTYLLDCY